MKQFKFIATKDDNDKINFEISTEGFSMFELQGFSKYFETIMEFKIIELVREKPDDSE